MLDIEMRDGALYLPVKVVPGASRTRCLGILGDRVKIAVSAPPEKGKANDELIAFLARRLGVRRGDVTVVHGAASPTKLVRIEHASREQIRHSLGIDRPAHPG